MRVIWICRHASFHGLEESTLHKIVEMLTADGVHSTLLYDPLVPSDHHYMAIFSRAFPLVSPEVQLSALTDAVIIYCDNQQAPTSLVPYIHGYLYLSSRRSIETKTPSVPIFLLHHARMHEDLPKLHRFLGELCRHSKPGSQPPLTRSASLSLSVIMRSHNDAPIIDQTLKALYSQTVLSFDLLIVDSGSTDATLEIVRRYPARIHSIAASEYFPGKILNWAMEHVQGEIAIFLNSDAVLLSPQSLEMLIQSFDDPQVQAAFARQLPRPNALSWVRRDYEASFPEHSSAPSWLPLSLCFAAMRRDIWKSRPFYTQAWGSEDTEWGTWALQAGYAIRYVPNSVCMHSHNYSLRQIYGRRYIEGEADAFIQGSSYPLYKVPIDWTKALTRDAIYAFKHRAFGLCVGTLLRRLVYYWAYYRGRLWGSHRLRTGDPNAVKGQKTVLEHYDDSRE